MKNIPKKIHYIWFGRNPKPKLLLDCIESWKKILPDYEIIEWNEDNYDINKHPYIKEAYNAKKYAFAADFARFDILFQYGGIYLDTDVELLKRIPDEYLKYEGFMGVESNNKIAPGLIMAVKPKNEIVSEIKDVYEKSSFVLEDGSFNIVTVVEHTTNIFKKYGFELNGERQNIKGIEIFPFDYFCAYDFDFQDFNITENTISIHHYAYTWGKKSRKIVKKIKCIIKRIIGKKNYKKIKKVLGKTNE